MSIDDYRPTFVVEAVYDLRADDLLRHGIHAVLVDLDNTLIAWNNPDGTPEVRAWLDEMTMADISVVSYQITAIRVWIVRYHALVWTLLAVQ